MFGRYMFLRLRAALLPDFERRWARDVERAVAPLRQQIADMQDELAVLRSFRRRSVVQGWAEANVDLATKGSVLLDPRVAHHVTRAVASAVVHETPTPHMVIDDILPRDVFDMLLAAIPPPEGFPDRDPVKTDLEMSALDDAPAPTAQVWRIFDQEIVHALLGPLVLKRLDQAVVGHYAALGGEAFGRQAAAIPHRSFAGRIQLRRPGYHLAPHLDPKRVVITGLFYLPRPGDVEDHGTQLFSVEGVSSGPALATFFPEQSGAICRLEKTVPYRANSLLVFVNSKAAHGATLPSTATLAERYTYQFYLKPDDGQLKKLLRTLPPEAQASWQEMLG